MLLVYLRTENKIVIKDREGNEIKVFVEKFKGRQARVGIDADPAKFKVNRIERTESEEALFGYAKYNGRRVDAYRLKLAEEK